jgi:hypothetical protein
MMLVGGQGSDALREVQGGEEAQVAAVPQLVVQSLWLLVLVPSLAWVAPAVLPARQQVKYHELQDVLSVQEAAVVHLHPH